MNPDDELGQAGTSKVMLQNGVLAFLDLGANESQILKLRDKWRKKGAPGAEWQKNCTANDRVSLQKLVSQKVTIMAGSDASNVGTFQGYSVHREMELLAAAGLSNWDALASATSVPAKFLGLTWGVQPGDVPNFLVLDASPIDSIGNTKKIRYIVHHVNHVNHGKCVKAGAQNEEICW